MSDQSATPRTAAFYAECCKGRDGEWITYTPDSKAWDFARQLERELAEVRRERDDAVNILKAEGIRPKGKSCLPYIVRAEQAERRAAELEADARRYRWLRECQSIPADILHNHHEALDAAIDAALESEKGDSHE